MEEKANGIPNVEGIPDNIVFDPETGEPIMTEEAKKNMDDYLNNIKDKIKDYNEVIQTQQDMFKRPPEWLIFEKNIIQTHQIAHIENLKDIIKFTFSDGHSVEITKSFDGSTGKPSSSGWDFLIETLTMS